MQTTEYVIRDRSTGKFEKSAKYVKGAGWTYTWTSEINEAKRWKQARATADGYECLPVTVSVSVNVTEGVK